MQRTCKRYFVDPEKLIDGVSIESLEKHGEQELNHQYEALLSFSETEAKKNKEQARKWLEAISAAHKKPGKNKQCLEN